MSCVSALTPTLLSVGWLRVTECRDRLWSNSDCSVDTRGWSSCLLKQIKGDTMC